MEWVETTGRSVEEAKDAALDQLGVDEEEAEFEILEEPKSGLFGRMRREARVRARILPKRPRPKADRRERRRRRPDKGDKPAGKGAGQNGAATSGGRKPSNGSKAGAKKSTTSGGKAADDRPAGGRGGASTEVAAAPAAEAVTTETTRATTTAPTRNPGPKPQGEAMSSETVSMEEQAAIIEEFLEGLTDAFGVDTEIRREDVDDELLEVQVEAADLGLLIGPKGQTLSAIQELSRTVLQRKATGLYEGRVRIDIGGYRNRRRQALERFATSVADQVRASGKQKVLEPMNPADRKVVHDTINEIDGVATTSEGTEPYRRVVIKPAG